MMIRASEVHDIEFVNEAGVDAAGRKHIGIGKR
jgi:hypothetical protein